MAKYRITRRAEDDLKNIGRYTQQHWGKAQRNVYLKNLENRFNWLAESPSYGMHAYSRPSLPLIPDEACHPFHANAATDSTAKLPPRQSA